MSCFFLSKEKQRVNILSWLSEVKLPEPVAGADAIALSAVRKVYVTEAGEFAETGDGAE